jgi:hypothetical protein
MLLIFLSVCAGLEFLWAKDCFLFFLVDAHSREIEIQKHRQLLSIPTHNDMSWSVHSNTTTHTSPHTHTQKAVTTEQSTEPTRSPVERDKTNESGESWKDKECRVVGRTSSLEDNCAACFPNRKTTSNKRHHHHHLFCHQGSVVDANKQSAMYYLSTQVP